MFEVIKKLQRITCTKFASALSYCTFFKELKLNRKYSMHSRFTWSGPRFQISRFVVFIFRYFEFIVPFIVSSDYYMSLTVLMRDYARIKNCNVIQIELLSSILFFNYQKLKICYQFEFWINPKHTTNTLYKQLVRIL